MFCTQFGLIPVLTSYLPYLILALVLFKGNRDTPLAVVVVLVALAAFLIPLWLVFSAEDDLRSYEEMGSIITPEELEAKRRELGLRRPAGK